MSSTQPERQLRIAMTLPSAASLGAYQSGAVAALLVAVQRLHSRAVATGRAPAVVVDAVGSASAGSLVALLATRCSMAGLDPLHVLHTAWVRHASWRRLRRGARDAPLSLALVERRARDLLDPTDRRGRPSHRVPASARQRAPVVLHLDLGCLQGLAYPLHGLGPVVEAFTHVDASDFVFRTQDDVASWTGPQGRSPLDVVLAAMSHPAAFAPKLLDRSGEGERYRRRGITNVPRSGRLWYADGGALVRTPVGGTLAAARRADRLHHASGVDATRVHLLVQPHTAAPESDGTWTDPEHPPRWTSSLSRVVAALSVESLYADQRRVEDANTRLARSDELVAALAPFLPADAGPALEDALRRMGVEDEDRAGSADSTGDGAAAALRRAVDAVSGLAGKQRVATEVVSPLRLLDQPGSPARREARQQGEVGSLLAGEFLGRFGGLLAREVRQSDFVTGWRSTRAWLADALPRYGVGQDDVAEALDAVDARDVEHDPAGPQGDVRLADLGLRERAQLAATVLHGARVALRDALRP